MTAMSSKESKPTSSLDAIRLRLGFKNRYDFALWSFFGGVLALFAIARSPLIHPRTFAIKGGPGEAYWMSQQPYKFGMVLHLSTIIPAALLCITQFVPIIRAKLMVVHRAVGYAVLSLVSVSMVGCLIVMPHTFGGDLSIISGVSVLALVTCSAMFMAWWNVRRLQIDQHRKWIIRAMAWMSQIITLRIILGASMLVVPSLGLVSIWTCDEALALAGNVTVLHTEFPQCHQLGPSAIIGVPMRMDSLLHAGSAFRGMFGASLWLAMALHAFAAEVYLALTSAESERLRVVSYHKQRAAGMAHPGSAGTTNDRWGDAKMWQPPSKMVD